MGEGEGRDYDISGVVICERDYEVLERIYGGVSGGALDAIVKGKVVVEDKRVAWLDCSGLNPSLRPFDIPEEIFGLDGLKSLDLMGNNLEYVPDGISRLENLVALDIGRNSIAELNPVLGNLRRLEYLNAIINQLRNFPDFVRDSNLSYLCLDKNSIVTVPRWILESERLKQIHLKYNPLSYDSKQVLGNFNFAIGREATFDG